MKPPKRHHYLPQFYLNGFAHDQHFFVYDREDNEYRKQTPKNTAVEKDFYTLTDDSGQKNTSIETIIAKIESRAKPVIDKLDSAETITFEERVVLSHFIALFIGRTPEYDATFKSLQDQLMRKANKVQFHSIERTQAVLDNYKATNPDKDTMSAEELFEFVQKDEYNIEFGRANTIDAMLEIAESLTKYFCQMNWVVYHSPRQTSFVTTDSPFIIFPPADRPKDTFFRGVGILTPGANKIIPLTQTTTLIMLDRGQSTVHKDLGRRFVRAINLNLASQCFRFVIGRDETLLKDLVSKTKIDQTKWKSGLIVG
ncbi:MAG: DUF4238 domain-containing protein [Bacteroidetes bacterium]|nr:DUF4238 domain-containing protein [Bacteroidota bacterium]